MKQEAGLPQLKARAKWC